MITMKKLYSILILALLLAACSGGGSATPAEPVKAATAEEPIEVPPSPEAVNSDGDHPLPGITWMWTGFTDPVQQFNVENPENYTLTFQGDGTVAIKADCNDAMGSYTLDGSSIKIEVGPMTMAACPPGSLSDIPGRSC